MEDGENVAFYFIGDFFRFGGVLFIHFDDAVIDVKRKLFVVADVFVVGVCGCRETAATKCDRKAEKQQRYCSFSHDESSFRWRLWSMTGNKVLICFIIPDEDSFFMNDF